MCGIAGVMSTTSDYRVTPELVTDMRETMVHRGPDGPGLWMDDDGRVGLGFRRLAIIDLSRAADQPMSNEDGSIRIVFNGEIYNHAEIRGELEAIGGHRWSTDHSDTEVIVHAFEQWGIDCLDRFRGMFAIAIWDAREQTLWLIRDRIGIKPLYYSVHGDHLSFASEIKALLKDSDQRRAVDEEALFHYLSFVSTPAPMTLFEGIRKVPPGSWLRFGADGSVREQRWWDVWEHTDPLVGVDEGEIAERLLAELRTAVRYRKVGDVPVGVFLSGGIDSSTNAALFSEGESRPVRTFSIGYEGEYESYQNELDWARRMADEVGAEYHERLLTQDDLIDFLPQMVKLQDEPIADPVCVPVYYVSKLARDNGVVVSQVGEGADELFNGYPWWQQYLRLQRLDDLPVPRVVKQLGLRGLRGMGSEGTRKFELLRRGAAGEQVFWSGAEAFVQAQKIDLLSPRLRDRFASRSSWEVLAPVYGRFRDRAWEPSALHWMTYADLSHRLPELLLMRVDKMSMGVSLEGRVPFLDHRFVELALSIPTEVKLRDRTLKHILKRAVRGVIPDEMIDRPKQGFGVPVYEWYQDRLGDRIRQDIADFNAATDFFDSTATDALLAQNDGTSAWILHNLAMWWKEYIA